MQFFEGLRLAIDSILSHKLRSFFTLLGIIVSVAFLVAVVAIIQGMNAYVRENLADAIVGKNSFQVRREPIVFGFIDDEEWKAYQRRPIITTADVPFIQRASPDAGAIALQSGWPPPRADVMWRTRPGGGVRWYGATPPFQVVQDYEMAAGEGLTDVDVRERRPVALLGYDVGDKLFDDIAMAPGQKIRAPGHHFG